MGLDMYLTKKVYIGAEYEHRKVTGSVEIFIDGKPVPVNFNKISYIEEAAGYWRKANQIHNWFVQNVQEGQDDCKDYHVERWQLEELLAICERIKKECPLVSSMVKNGEVHEPGTEGFTPIYEEGKAMTNWELAEELLPTQSGFFFGSTDYDQYYMQDIENTIEIIKEALQADNNAEFYYSSSW